MDNIKCPRKESGTCLDFIELVFFIFIENINDEIIYTNESTITTFANSHELLRASSSSLGVYILSFSTRIPMQ